jgi:hypothetical protein
MDLGAQHQPTNQPGIPVSVKAHGAPLCDAIFADAARQAASSERHDLEISATRGRLK